jgi:hypothetical protein
VCAMMVICIWPICVILRAIKSVRFCVWAKKRRSNSHKKR